MAFLSLIKTPCQIQTCFTMISNRSGMARRLMYDHPTMSKIESQEPKKNWSRLSVVLTIYTSLLICGYWGANWLIKYVGMEEAFKTGDHVYMMMIIAITIYTVLMIIPFVPGVEISLALLAAFGPDIAMTIYAATIVALSAAYLIGRLLPVEFTIRIFNFLGLSRAEALLLRLEPMNSKQRLDVLVENTPKKIVPLLLRHRYLAIAFAFNLPGNTIIGGGGGIALLAGLSGLFTFSSYLLIVSLAVLPVPLFIMLMGN